MPVDGRVNNGGARPGAGRKKGSREHATPEQLHNLSALAREHTLEALDVLVKVAKDASSSDAARVAAANAILDRGYGRPKQAVEHSGENGGPIQVAEMSDEEAVKRMLFVIAKARKERSATLN